MYYYRAWAEIDYEAAAFNLEQVRAALPKHTSVMVVLKADAYGHGAAALARHLETRGIWGFGVGDSKEALELRESGITCPILILGTIIEDEISRVVKHGLSVCIHSQARVERLNEEALRHGKTCRVHLMVDTGMGRLGVFPENALPLARRIRDSKGLALEGVATHCSSAADPDDAFTLEQLQRFSEVRKRLDAEDIRPGWYHAANSGALYANLPGEADKRDEAEESCADESTGPTFNLVRPGIVIYGIAYSRKATNLPPLRPVLSLKSQIIYMKDVPRGTPIGYDRIYRAPKRTRIATLPIGYNDGLPYRLSGRGKVLIRGREAPIVGAVSMDYIMIDVGHIRDAAVGDPVTIIGRDGDGCIRVEDLAELAETIPYEITCRIGRRIRRVARFNAEDLAAGGKGAPAPQITRRRCRGAVKERVLGGRIAALLLLPLLLTGQIITVVMVLASSDVAERELSRLFRKNVDARLAVDRVGFDPFAGLTFHGLRVIPEENDTPYLTVESLSVSVDGSALLEGIFRPTVITLDAPRLVLEQCEDGSFPLETIIAGGEEKALSMTPGRGFSVVVRRAEVSVTGDGPLPMALADIFRPGALQVFEIPFFQYVESDGGDTPRSLGFRFRHEVLGELAVNARLDDRGIVRATLRPEAIRLGDPEVLARLGAPVREAIEEMGFEGVLDADIEVFRVEDMGYESQVRFRGFDVRPEAFPLPLRNLRGTLRLTPGSRAIVEARGDSEGGDLTVRADFRLGSEWRGTVRLEGENMPCTPDLERAVERVKGGRDYRAFAPEGRSDFIYEGEISHEDPRLRGRLTLRARTTSASYEGYIDPVSGIEDAFPFRLYDLMGEVRILPDHVEIDGITGYTGPSRPKDLAAHPDEAGVSMPSDAPAKGRVRIDGRVGIRSGGQGTDLTITARDLPLNDKVMRALMKQDPAIVEYLEQFNFTGRVDLVARIAHGPERSYGGTDLDIDLKSVNMCYDGFPYPVKDIRGRVTVRDGRVSFTGLKGLRGPANEYEAGLFGPENDEGDLESGALDMSGIIEGGRMTRFMITGRRQRITPRLKTLLKDLLPDELGGLADVDYLGCADFNLDIDRSSEGDASDGEHEPASVSNGLVLNLHFDALSGGPLPLPLEDVRGMVRVAIDTQDVIAENLNFRGGNGRFTCSSLEVHTLDDSIEVEAEGAVRSLALDADLEGLLGPALNEAWVDFGARGLVDLDRFDLKAVLTEQGSLAKLEGDLDLRASGCLLENPLKLEKIHGSLGLNFDWDPVRDESLALRGRTRDLSLDLDGRLFTDVSAGFRMEDGVFNLDDLDTRFYGGRIRGVGERPLRVELDVPRGFEGRFAMEKAPLEQMFDPGDYAMRNVAGKVSGQMSIRGEADNLHLLQAEGELAVTEGMLFEVPLLGDLSRIIGTLFGTDPPSFTGGRASFTLEEGVVTVDGVNLKSSLMELNGAGIMTLDGVDMNFIPATSFVPEIPILGDLVNLVKDGLFTFKISGPYSNLRVNYETLVSRLFKDTSVPDAPRYAGRIGYEFEERF